jgi:hypothetical protein
MSWPISEQTFLDGLQAGVKNTADLMFLASEFHGGAVQTEYLLTTDIAREFIKRRVGVKVECLYRNLVNSATAPEGTFKKRHKKLGSKRTDVALVQDFVPLAMIEVKIGIRKLTGIKEDLKKIASSMRLMQTKYAKNVIGASVFQVHLDTTRHRYEEKHFWAAIGKIESNLKSTLKTYERYCPGFAFSMHSLQAPDEGFAEPEEDQDGDGELIIGRPRHVTRYYAILMRCTRQSPPVTLEELKRRSAAK